MTRKSKPLPTRLASRLFREALSKTVMGYQLQSPAILSLRPGS